MNFAWEVIKFIVFSLLIVVISKYILVNLLRKFSEALKLKAKTVGSIAGIATSVPELLTISFSSFTGLMDASIYNVLSSNVINLLQYAVAVILNKNTKTLKNKAIKIDLFLVLATILIPIIMLIIKVETELYIVPIFLILFFLFFRMNTKMHQKTEREVALEKEIKEEEKQLQGKKGIVIKYLIYLLLTSILLFVVGNQLSNALENLCNIFNVPQFVIGIALGFATSLPELITFFESQRHHSKQDNQQEGVIEATNNLFTSNIANLFIIQSIGILIYTFVK